MSYQNIFRGLLMTVGILGVIFSVIAAGEMVFSILETEEGENPNIERQEVGELIPIGVLFFFSWVLLHLALYWNTFLKSMTQFMLTISVVLFSIGLFLMIVYSFSGDITEDIQPSIDHISVEVLDQIIKNQFSYDKGEIVTLQLAEPEDSRTIKVGEVSASEREFLISLANLSGVSPDKQDVLIDYAISELNSTISSQPSLSPPVPISIFDRSLDLGSTFDTEEFSAISAESLKNQLLIRSDAQIRVFFDEDMRTLDVEIGNITTEQTEDIWQYLNFGENLSIKTKQLMTGILLSSLNDQFPEDQKIPVTSIDDLLPDSSKELFSYDLFSENTSDNIEELNRLRDDCKQQTVKLDALCQGVVNTEYEGMMNTFEDINGSGRNLDSINTLPKLENNIREIASIGSWWVGLALIFLISAFLVHLKFLEMQKTSHIGLRTLRFITKDLLIKGTPLVILTVLTYYLFSSGQLFSLLANGMPEFAREILLSAADLPVIETLTSVIIRSYLILISLLYAFTGILFLWTRWFLKRKEEEIQDHP